MHISDGTSKNDPPRVRDWQLVADFLVYPAEQGEKIIFDNIPSILFRLHLLPDQITSIQAALNDSRVWWKNQESGFPFQLRIYFSTNIAGIVISGAIETESIQYNGSGLSFFTIRRLMAKEDLHSEDSALVFDLFIYREDAG